MREKVTIVCAALALAGCVAAPPAEPLPPSPTCRAQAQCDFKWAAARTFVLAHSGYKFQTYTADFMETFNAVGASPELAARVNKEPQPDGTFKIVATFWCDNLFGCVPPARKTLIEFIETVSQAEPTTQ